MILYMFEENGLKWWVVGVQAYLVLSFRLKLNNKFKYNIKVDKVRDLFGLES